MEKTIKHILVVNPYLVGEYSLGGAKRIYRMLEHFAQSVEKVSLACFSDHYQSKTRIWTSKAHDFCQNVITAKLPERGKLKKSVEFFLAPKPASVYFHSSMELKQKIKAVAERDKIDFVHVEFFDMADFVLEFSRSVPRVLVTQEVMSLAKKENANVKDDFKNFVQGRKIKGYEKQIARKFDHCYCITNEEKTYLESIGVTNSRLFPHVVNTDEFAPGDHDKEDRDAMFFLGDFHHKPNQDALYFFVKDIFPCIRKQYPSAVFHVVGANIIESLLRGLNTDNVRIHGEVDNIRKYYEMTSIFVNPIVSGGGMRGKVLEAMSMKKAVVSTPLGVQGIDVRDQEEVLLAQSPQDFANAAVSLLKEPARRRSLGCKARVRIQELYEERCVFDRLLDEYRELFRKKRISYEKR